MPVCGVYSLEVLHDNLPHLRDKYAGYLLNVRLHLNRYIPTTLYTDHG